MTELEEVEKLIVDIKANRLDHYELHAAARKNNPLRVRLAVAHSRMAGAKTYARLADSWDTSVVDAVMSNSQIPKTVIKVLESDWSLRNACYLFAQQSADSINVLSVLSASTNTHIRTLVGSNPNVSIETVVKLSVDDEWLVRQSIANNPSTPRSIVADLVDDENAAVSISAKKVLAGEPVTASWKTQNGWIAITENEGR
jgi:hypothetical protein